MSRYKVGDKVNIYVAGKQVYPGDFEVLHAAMKDGNPVLSVPPESREQIGQDTFSISENYMILVDG